MKHCVISILISVSFFLSVARAIPINQGETYLTDEVVTALQQLFNQKVYIIIDTSWDHVFSVCVDILVLLIILSNKINRSFKTFFCTLQNEMQTVNEEANKAVFQHTGNDSCMMYILLLLLLS